jgi:uncharacterized protein (TIGR02265 family)
MSKTDATATNLRVKKLAFESLAKGTGILDNPALLQQVKHLYDPLNTQNDYPAESFTQFVELLRQKLYPTLPREKGLIELGRQGLQGFYKGTIIGGIMLAAIKVMKPMRLIKVGARMWDDVGIGQVEPVEITPTKIECRNRNFLLDPYFPVGMTLEALEISGAKNVRYQVKTLANTPAPHSYNYNVVYEVD